MRWIFILSVAMLAGCGRTHPTEDPATRQADSLAYVRERQAAEQAAQPALSEQIELGRELLHHQHSLADEYRYGGVIRRFQWKKIKEGLAFIENQHRRQGQHGVLQNRQDKNGRAPLPHKWRINKYDRAADTLGVERYQGIPLYSYTDTVTPLIYGLDGALVRIIHSDERWTWLESFATRGAGAYLVPNRYVYHIADTVLFRHVALIDRKMQHIVTLERSGNFGDTTFRWLVRSMNPATTGASNPPYQQSTPLGIFVVQEKKPKMFYTEDGAPEIAGFASWASRFCNGGYIHSVPVNDPHGQPIEYSWTLGTIPRSHMCVRNATSHAEFVYKWAPIDRTLVMVIE